MDSIERIIVVLEISKKNNKVMLDAEMIISWIYIWPAWLITIEERLLEILFWLIYMFWHSKIIQVMV